MKKLLVVVLVAIYACDVESAMSEAQLKAALKLLRNVCQPKFKATDEQIVGMHKGDWNQDRAGMCYLWCALNMYKMISKDNKFEFEGALQTMKAQAPDSIRESAMKSVTNCKDAVKTTSDKCVAAYEIAKCIYEDDPEHYFLP